MGQRTALSVDSNGYLASVTDPAGRTVSMTYTPLGLMRTFTDPNGNRSVLTYDADGALIRDVNADLGFWALSSEVEPGLTVVELSSAMRRTTTLSVEELGTGDERRTTTGPDGTQLVRLKKKDGTTVATLADGTVATVVEARVGRNSEGGSAIPGTMRASTDLRNGHCRRFRHQGSTPRVADFFIEREPRPYRGQPFGHPKWRIALRASALRCFGLLPR